MGRRRKRKSRAPLKMARTNAHVTYKNHPRFYVGYGSNHNLLQMSWRCPSASPVCAGMIPDKKLVFSDVLTIEDCKGRAVPVSIWHVTPTDILALDRYEGYPHLYGKRFTHVEVKGERVEAFYYVMNPPYSVSPPYATYEATVRQGFRDWGFSMETLDAAIAEAWGANPYREFLTKDEPLSEYDILERDYFGHEWEKWEENATSEFDPSELDWNGPERYGGMVYGRRPKDDDDDPGKWADDPDPFDDDFYEPYRRDDWMSRVVW